MPDSSARASRGLFRRHPGNQTTVASGAAADGSDGVSLDLLADEDLISRTRDGSSEAFEVLWVRHAASGRRVAARFTRASDPEDLVQEAYLRIYSALSHGKGPDGAFRPYLYQAIRNIAISWAGKPQTDSIDVIAERSDGSDMSETVLENTVTAKAFRKLPERWQSILWYSEVEGMEPAEIAPLMGLKASAVSALAYRAREGLRREWLQVHVNAEDVPHECRWAAERMGDFNRGALRGAAKDKFTDHVSSCSRCMVLIDEVNEVSRKLGLILVPLTVGIPWAVFASMTAAAAVGVAAAGAGAAAATATSGGLAATAGTAAAGGAAGSGAGGGAGGGAASSGTAWVVPAALIAVASVAVVAVAGVLVVNNGWLGSADQADTVTAESAATGSSDSGASSGSTDTSASPTDDTDADADLVVTEEPASPESPENLPRQDVLPSSPLPTSRNSPVVPAPTAPGPTLPPSEPAPTSAPTPTSSPTPKPTSSPTPKPTPSPTPSPSPSPTPPPVVDGPAVPVITDAPANRSTLTTFPTLAGTADPDTEIIVESPSGKIFATATSDAEGLWSIGPLEFTGPDSDSMIFVVRAVRDGETSKKTNPITYNFVRPTLSEPADGSTTLFGVDQTYVDADGITRASQVTVKVSGDSGLYVQIEIDGTPTASRHLMDGSLREFAWINPALGDHTMSVRYITVEGDVITSKGPRVINSFTLSLDDTPANATGPSTTAGH